MSNCQNLCTAEKCAELEERIANLESLLEQHLNQKIPDAHRWSGSFDIFLSSYQQTLTVELHIDNIDTKSAKIKLPFVTEGVFNSHLLANINDNNDLAHTYYPEIDHNLTVYNTKNGISLHSEIYLEGFLASDFADIDLNNIDTNLKIGGTVIGRNLILTVADRNSSDSEEIPLPFTFINEFENHLRDKIPDAHEYNPLINVNAGIEENTLFIDVAIDDNSDVATVELPVFEPVVNVSAQIIDNTLFISVAIDDNSDVATVELNEMNCENLENLIINTGNDVKTAVQTENNENQAKIDSIIYQIDLRTGEIESIVNELLQQLNQSFANSFVTGNCQETTTETGGQIEWGQMSYSETETVINGSGITGIAQLIQLINTQISSLHRDLCGAIPPNFNLKNVTPLTCLEEGEAPVKTEKFLEEDTDFNYLLSEFQGNSENPPQPNTVILRKNIYQYLAYKLHLLQEQQINQFQLTCNNDSSADVVSIIANDKVINRVSSTQLILHFVTLDNYPKRARNSSYRPIQIPGAKKPTEDNSSPYNWSTDFEDFFWIQGNQYAELRFEENYAPVSGWFENQEAANTYFDKVLTLTTATESNRVIPLHSNSKTNIPVRTTRPYRAFICELNQQGQNQCLAKYQP